MAFNLFLLANNDTAFNKIEDFQSIVVNYFSFDNLVKISLVDESFRGRYMKMS